MTFQSRRDKSPAFSIQSDENIHAVTPIPLSETKSLIFLGLTSGFAKVQQSERSKNDSTHQTRFYH
ncbi:hypothetical protein EA58_12185 [Photobacterium galatheae]|uniref:Uncharacterized protein n=1 Tax=Photobacterium galatheae TaxID=1654360 RepID=A0A066RVB6_9GAMM|nr:hypothetical protein EA58_12185 [Photobacterium galatheae]